MTTRPPELTRRDRRALAQMAAAGLQVDLIGNTWHVRGPGVDIKAAAPRFALVGGGLRGVFDDEEGASK